LAWERKLAARRGPQSSPHAAIERV
jgi:hypothetical protein